MTASAPPVSIRTPKFFVAQCARPDDAGLEGKLIMPTYITQGRYSREAIQGMIKKPEDRAKAVSKLLQGVGGRVLSYYVTFGEYDFLLIAEAPDELAVSAAVLAAAAGGGATDLKTTVAMSTSDAMQAFKKAGELAASFKSAGQGR